MIPIPRLDSANLGAFWAKIFPSRSRLRRSRNSFSAELRYAQWLPSGCPVAAQWLPSGSWSWWMVMVDRDAICEFGIFMEFWSRNNLRMLEMNGVDSQDAYVAAASLFLTSPYMVGCHREPVVFGNESPSGGIALQHLLLVV